MRIAVVQAAGAVRSRRRRDLHGPARRRAARAGSRRRPRLGSVQVVSGRAGAHAGVPLADARPRRGGRPEDRRRRRDEVPVVPRAPRRQARLARPPVPAGLRARRHAARAVRRLAGGSGASAEGAGARSRRARRGVAPVHDLAERRGTARGVDRARGRGAAAPAAGARLPLPGLRATSSSP